MRTQLDLDEFIPTMDTPEKVYQLFDSLGYKVLDSRLKTNPSVYNLPVKEAALVEKIYAVSNYDRRFQILLFKLKEENKEAIRTIPEKILREVDFPFIIFTPDFKTYTFTLVEKVREGPGEFKRKLTKLVIDSSQPYHTDKEILGSLALSVDIKTPVEVYKLFQGAFSVEKVTKKFFTEYREVFERLVREVTKQNNHLKFTLFSRDASVENFVKILLGRLMFLYFIQKRGWLNCFDGWGSGDKKFLYNKFQEAKKEKKNYFKDYLEPLFFDTLNNPRRDKPDQATQFGGRIPFLNGGLFEPEYDYQDVRNHILLENSTFDDVFSVFEKYNFTVKEDEPLEKEVAIDPEMLGKVFENLLEENLRKGKGTYYTPREIVHYMCHESLINYLASEVSLDQDVIRNFLDREQSLEKKETLSSVIRGKAKEIDEKLADIKVLDPACGSGAFLVGMLHEVINARLSLNRELGRSFSEYELKKATIQNNIYGVDIDPGATEIAKLRLWLTLVVDHNLSEIEPLPNLDYKIMVGNSLLDEFMGVKLFNFEKARQQPNGKKVLKLFEDDIKQVELFEEDNKSGVLKALQKLHALYFKESDPERKKQIRIQIDKIEFDLIETTVKDEVKKLEDEISHITSNPMLKGLGIPKEIADKIIK
ncbi:N-6 DNA methylase, partial [Candidatus Collierbacteria bacterium]|nr:N-6 DNA methylase [Candidatus Collierbacteria bacterium]